MIAKRIIKNTSYNAIGRVWFILVNFLLTPLILSYLGDQRFALWVLFWTFASWFSFMDMGLAASVIRDVAGYSLEDDAEEINKTLCSSLAFNFIVGLLVLLLVWGTADWLVSILHVSEALQGDALALAYIGPIAFMLLGMMSIFDAFLRGLQRYGLIVIASLIVSFINVLTVWLVLYYGYGIYGLVASACLVYLIQLGLLLWFSRQAFAHLSLRFSYVSLAKIRQMLPFGLHVQIARLAELASYQTDKIILAVLTPLYFVTSYELGSKIASLLSAFSALLMAAIFPSVSQMHANKDSARIWIMYERGSKYLWMASTPLFLGLCLVAPLIIELWLGYVSPDVYQALMILALGYWSTVNVAVLYNIGFGIGWSKPVMYISLLQAVSNVALSWILASTIGFVGVLYGTSITLMATSALLYFRFSYDFDRVKRRDFWMFARVLSANVPPALACLGYLYASGHLVLDMAAESRATVIAPLLICVAIYGSVYLISIRLARLLDRTDLEWLGAYCPALIRKYLFLH